MAHAHLELCASGSHCPGMKHVDGLKQTYGVETNLCHISANLVTTVIHSCCLLAWQGGHVETNLCQTEPARLKVEVCLSSR